MRTEHPRKILLWALTLAVALAVPAVADIEAFDPGFVFDVIDPGFCEMPPEEYSDGDIIEMLRALDPPVSGELRGPIAGSVLGVGYFKADSGIVATFSSFILVSDSELKVLCMAIMPVGTTDLESGEARLVGPVPESADEPTYLAVVQIGERDGERVIPIGNLEGGIGTIHLRQPHSETLEGSLSLSGRIEGVSVDTGTDFVLTLDFEDMRLSPLRMLRLSEN
jgi:hypothetical protein